MWKLGLKNIIRKLYLFFNLVSEVLCQENRAEPFEIR